MPILPVSKIALYDLSKRFVLKSDHQLNISHHVVNGVVLPHFDAVESLSHLCVDDEENLEVSYEFFLAGLLPSVECEGADFALTATTVRLKTVDAPDLTRFLHAHQVLVKARGHHLSVSGDRLCPEALRVLFLLINDHVGVVPILCLHGTGPWLQVS